MPSAKSNRQKTEVKRREIIIDGVSLGIMEFAPGANADQEVRGKFRRIFGSDFAKHTLQIAVPGGKRSASASK